MDTYKTFLWKHLCLLWAFVHSVERREDDTNVTKKFLDGKLTLTDEQLSKMRNGTHSNITGTYIQIEVFSVSIQSSDITEEE